MGEIKVGTASWTDRTLLNSGWYPQTANNPEKRLVYYAKQFPLVEVDATYYGPPAEQTTRLWAQRTPAGFTFNIKAFSLLTGHPTKVSSIYRDLRPETDKKNVYPDDLPPQAYEEIWTRFLSALDPLVEAGKLGALLFQFPPWFGIRTSNKEYLLEVAARCAPLRPVFELRNASWFHGANHTETLDWLRAHRLPFVSVDMPQGHRSSVLPILEATADLAVVRFHGHSDKVDQQGHPRKVRIPVLRAGARQAAPGVVPGQQAPQFLGPQLSYRSRRRRGQIARYVPKYSRWSE